MPESPEPATLPARSNGKHPGGRPTKRTPATVAKIAEAIADGLPDEYACALVGINRETLYQWRNDPEFTEFSNTIKKAEASRIRIRLGRIEAGEEGWQGTAWFMERRYPREFSRPEVQFNQQINVQQVGAVDHPVHMIPQSELLEMLAVVARVDGQMELEAPLEYEEEQATPWQPV